MIPLLALILLGGSTTSSVGTEEKKPHGPVEIVGLKDVTGIAAGHAHNCALTSAGAVKCWGYNGNGQLGDGKKVEEYHNTPVDVVGLSTEVRAIAAGGAHTCALTSAGAVKCWGNNQNGQLGDGTTEERSGPVDVVGLSTGVRDIAVSEFHSCALTSEGGVKCWGWNYAGQLGDGTKQDRHAPVDVVGLSSEASGIASGKRNTCAVTSEGGVKCWGHDRVSMQGPPPIDHSSVPVEKPELQNVVATAIATGFAHRCVLTSVGAVKCWGANYYGELGNGTWDASLTPVDVVGLSSRVRAIAAGEGHACALTSEGRVKCWGNNSHGQLGAEVVLNKRSTPVDVVGLSSGVRAIAVGDLHTCALTSAGAAKCWGAGY